MQAALFIFRAASPTLRATPGMAQLGI